MTPQLPPMAEPIEILIVEDSPTQAIRLRYLLEQKQYRVIQANNGKQALAFLDGIRPALVISDINMPEMTGFELCQRIKEEQRLQDIPVILLTSMSDTEDVLEGLACGADSFITKPYSAPYLMELVERTLADTRVLSQARLPIKVEVNLGGKKRVITTSPQQTVSLLLSTYEAAIHRNLELAHTQAELSSLNEHLEDLVTQRTTALSAEIIERKQAEEIVKASESKYRELVELASDGIALIDPEGHIIETNTRYCEISGYSRAELLQMTIRDIIASEDLEQTSLDFTGIQAGQTLLIERLWRRKDDSQLPVELSAKQLPGGNTQAIIRDISQRKQLEAALIQSERAYRTLFENSPIGLYRTQVDGQILDANPALAKTFGYQDRSALLALNIVDLYVDPGSNERFKAEIEKHDVVTGFEAEFYCQDGTTFWAEDYIRVVRDQAGTIVAYEGSLLDVTERKRAAAALKESETRFARLFHGSPAAISLSTLADGRLVDINEAFERMLGFPKAEAIGKTAQELGVWPESERRDEMTEALRQRRALNGLEVTFLRRSGESVETLTSLEIIILNGEENIIGLSQDITSLKLAEAAVRASEERFRLVARATQDVLWDWDVLTGQHWWNEAFFTLFGYQHDAIPPGSKSWNDNIHPDDYQRVNDGLQAVINGNGDTWTDEYRFRCADDSYRLVLDRGYVVRDAAGRSTRMLGSMVDLTVRKQAEEKIRFQAHLLDTVGQAVIATDLAGIVIYWNRFAETMYGWTAAEALGHNLNQEMISGATPEHGAEIFADLVAGGSWTGEYPARHRDGTRFPILVADSPIRAEDGTLIGVVGISTDISDIKQHEHELEALAEASIRLRPTEARVEMPAVVLDMLMTLFKAEGAALVIHDAPAGEWLVELGRGNLANATGVRKPDTSGPSGHVIASGQLYLTNNITLDKYGPMVLPLLGPQAMAGVPLIAQNRTIGVLWIGRQAPITQAETRVLIAFADIAANAVQRAALHNQTERRLRQLQSLHAIDQAIKSSLDLRLTLTLLLEHITTQLQVDAACILIVNQHTKFLEFVAGRGFHSKLNERVQVRLGQGYAGQAALERQIVHIPDLSAAIDNKRLMKTLEDESFVSYYAVPLIAKGQVQGVLEIFHREPLKPDDEWLAFLDSLADQTAIAIDSAQLFADLQRTNTDLLLAYSATIEGWSRALDLRDKETEGHSQRVTEITLDLAQAVGGFSESEFIYIRWGSLLHDIGKMGIPDQILLKPGKLTDEEWLIMRQHPAFAYQLLLPIAYLRPALDIPYAHHEKWDGTGYPRGLKGEQIPRAARLFAVVDVWDALRSDRPYRLGWPEEKVREYIAEQSGTHFDPNVVQGFLQMLIVNREPLS